MTRGSAVARRYARALYGLGAEPGDAEALLAEVDALTELVLAHQELRRALFTPIHPRAERRGLIAALARRLELSDTARIFAMLLIDENRAARLPQIRDALHKLVERAAGRVEAEISSARPLDAAEVEELRAALSQRVNAGVTVTTRVDESLIGGVVARVGDLLLDGSLRTQLGSLAGSLEKGSL